MASGSDVDAASKHPQAVETTEDELGAAGRDRTLETGGNVSGGDLTPETGGAVAGGTQVAPHDGGRLDIDQFLESTNQEIQQEGSPTSPAIVSQGLRRAIRSKNSWENKLGDTRIVAKYQREAIDQGIPKEVVEETIKSLQSEARYNRGTDRTPGASTSASTSTSTMRLPKAVQTISEGGMQDLIHMVAALQFKIGDKMEESLAEKGNGVWHADNIVPTILRDMLERGLDAIADLPKKDFHPNSKDQVQDLIHPSLFPYITGVSPLTVQEADLPPRSRADPKLWVKTRPWEASKYQWLPSQFQVEPSGSVNIMTYINNLDRESHGELYRAIELLFEIFLPMFEKLLLGLAERNKEAAPSIRGRELQVIVKAANYVIQPMETAYEGEWHVEGMSHEHILASGIYYYSTSPGLKDAGLEFRRFRDENTDWPQTMEYNVTNYYFASEEDDEDLEQYLPEDAPTRVEARAMYDKLTKPMQFNIHLGAVPTEPNRLLVFSNEMQHKVSKIVNDSDKVGVRKILVFFLVDPDVKIVSTRHVREQQWEKGLAELVVLLNKISVQLCGKRLSSEIALEILSKARFGMTMAEAKRHRLILMKERAKRVREEKDEWEEEYALCEH